MIAWMKRLGIFGALILVPAVVLACSVPVFRYALDHWHPDAYQVFVYHNEDLGEQDQSRLQRFEDEAADFGANVQIRAIDLREELDARDRARWERANQAEGASPDSDVPRMVVNLPAGIAAGEAIVGTAPWNDEQVQNLLSSPARTELGERLIRGEVVWVYLESGRAADDEIRYELLRGELAKQQETLELPAIDPNDLDELSGDAEDLAIRFSTMRISRDDPAEKWFREMLLSTEPDLRDDELVDQAMVFPVFGRGRALYALVGDGINPDVIKEAAIFLTGACQCTVKAENPGVDLLIPVRWEQYIQPPEPEAFDLPLVGLAGMVSDDSSVAGGPQGDTTDRATDPTALLASVDRPQNTAGSRDSAASADAIVGDASQSGSRESHSDSHTADGGAAGHGDSAMVVAAEGPAWLRWLPWGVLVVVGLVVLLSGLSLMRGKGNA